MQVAEEDFQGSQAESLVFLLEGLLMHCGRSGFYWSGEVAQEPPRVSLMLCGLSLGPAVCQFKCTAASVMSCNSPTLDCLKFSLLGCLGTTIKLFQMCIFQKVKINAERVFY